MNDKFKSASVVDLFCGVGGLSYGLKKAGLKVVAGLDVEKNCAYPYEANTGARFYQSDISRLTSKELNTIFGETGIKILAGCAPCQPFSTYSQSRKSVDNRWTLLNDFLELALSVRPEVLTMENVVSLSKLDIWTDFVNKLRESGYHVTWSPLKCEVYGVPQSRKRLVLIASLYGEVRTDNIRTPKGHKTVKEAIGHLRPIASGDVDPIDSLHFSSSLSEINLKRIRASKPGGTWRDWPKELVAKCHTKDTGKSYPSVYGRMEWDKPSPTITTQYYGFGNGRFGHPEQDRGLSIREGAILQSFPEDYKFVPDGVSLNTRGLGTLIGNAVPPKLGEYIGNVIREHIFYQVA